MFIKDITFKVTIGKYTNGAFFIKLGEHDVPFEGDLERILEHASKRISEILRREFNLLIKD